MVKILQHHTVVRDGWHNMEPDLAFWRDYYWIAYRRITGHFASDGGIVILRSVDLKRWQEVTYLKTIGCEWTPRFCATENRLFVYFYTVHPWLEGIRTIGGDLISRPKVVPERFTHVCHTDDGIHWTKPAKVWKNQWVFDVRHFSDRFYATAYGYEGDMHDRIHGPLDLLSSGDGLNWKTVSTIAGVEDRINEAALFFHADGELWTIAATWKKPHNYSLFFKSDPPYKKWERFDLKVRLNSPVFCETKGTIFVAGRRWTEEPWKQTEPAQTAKSSYSESLPIGNAAIWTVEKGKVTPFFALPSIGDMWQPGMISTEPGKLIVSYNSQHAYLTGVIPSKTSMPPGPIRPDIYVGDDDIYIIEIAID